MQKGDETNRDLEDGSNDTARKGTCIIHMHVRTCTVYMCVHFLYADVPIQYQAKSNLYMVTCTYTYTCTYMCVHFMQTLN